MPTVSWAQQMKDGARSSCFTSLSFLDSKKVSIYCWVDRERFPDAYGQTQRCKTPIRFILPILYYKVYNSSCSQVGHDLIDRVKSSSDRPR